MVTRINGIEVSLDKVRELSDKIQSLRFVRNDTSVRKTLEESINDILSIGYVSDEIRLVYDMSSSKFASIYSDVSEILYHDNDKSVIRWIEGNLGLAPKYVLSIIPRVVLEFNPYKNGSYVKRTAEVVNTFIPNIFLQQRGKATTINKVIVAYCIYPFGI